MNSELIEHLPELVGCSAYASLPPRRQAFVREYLSSGFNGAAAARASGYSKHSDRQIASELLTFPNVRAAIRELLDSEGLGDPRVLAAYVRQELIKSVREGKPAERMKALVILARASGLLGGPPPPAQHLHLHGAELGAEERQRILGMRRRPPPLEG